jgi:hypothetical protein
MKSVGILTAVLLAGTATVVSAQAPCSVETIRGTYAWEMTGRTFDGGISAETLPGGIPMLEGTVFPIHTTGVITVGRGGTAEGRWAGLVGLVPLGYPTPLPFTASFTVHTDCTGELTAPNAFGGINTDKFVILDNGQEIRSVGMSGAPFAWQFTMVRIGRADEQAATCGRNTVRGRYVMRCQGFEGAPTQPPAYAGVLPMFVLDVAADGTMTGRQFARDHTLNGLAVTGAVTVKPDCTTLMTVRTEALPGATILATGVFYDNGKEGFGGPILAFFGEQPALGAFAGFACHMTRLTR